MKSRPPCRSTKSFFAQSWQGRFHDLLEKDFAILYYSKGAISISDIGEMNVAERDFFYNRWQQIREEEKKLMEEQAAKAEAAAKTAASRRRSRR